MTALSNLQWVKFMPILWNTTEGDNFKSTQRSLWPSVGK
jgi:hypothetical protein